MYIQRRRARINSMAGMQWATDIATTVQAAGGRTSLWAGGPGSTLGTMAWSSLVDSFAELTEMNEQLMANDDYLALLGQAGQHLDSTEPDTLMEVIHGEIAGQAEIGSVLSAVSAVPNPARGAEAATWAPTIADAWAEATGIPVVVTTNAAGPMGEIGWFAVFESPGAVDDANAKLAASTAYQEASAGGAGLFDEGLQQYARRIA
jgi:hypothetical protein